MYLFYHKETVSVVLWRTVWCYLLQSQGLNIVLAQNSANSSLKFLTKQVYQSLQTCTVILQENFAQIYSYLLLSTESCTERKLLEENNKYLYHQQTLLLV